MTVEELLARAGDQIGVRRVFGEPIERDGAIVVPVAVVMGGGGAGTGEDQQGGHGTGSGFGVYARGIGAYEIRDGRVRYVPAVDLASLGLLALAAVWTLTRVARRSRRRSR